MLFGKNLEKIQYHDLITLIDNHISEGKTTEYKSQLPGSDYEAKKEFLSDVSSFSNASGGYIFYGIEETKGEATDICGVGEIDPDAEILKFENSLRDNIYPRIQGIKIQSIQIDTTNYVIIIKIPRSWARPHVVNFQSHWRFYSRNSAGKYPLDVSELKSAFLLSETLAQRIRNFRAERLGSIVANEMPVSLHNKPKLVFHLIPINAFELSTNLDIHLDRHTRDLFLPINWTVTHFRYNLDGFIAYSQRQDNEITSYLQFYRNGIFESVDTSILDNREDDVKFIKSLDLEIAIMRASSRYVSILNDLYEIDPPYFILISMVGVKDIYIKQGYNAPLDWLENARPIDRDIISVPELILNELESRIDVFFKPVIDIIWNAAGESGSLNYTPDGRWKKLTSDDLDSFTFNNKPTE